MAPIIADSAAIESAHTPHICEANKNCDSDSARCRSLVSEGHPSFFLQYREPTHHGVMGANL